MPLYVNAEDWNRLSSHTRENILDSLRDCGMLRADETIQVDGHLPSLAHEEKPTLSDARIANLLCLAERADLAAVSILSCSHLSGSEKETCFIVVYDTRT